MKRLAQLAIAALTISAIYLYAWPAPNLFYVGAVLFHTGLGVAFCVAGLFLRRDALRGPLPVKLGVLVLAAGSVPWTCAHLHGHVAFALEFDVRAHYGMRGRSDLPCSLVLEPA